MNLKAQKRRQSRLIRVRKKIRGTTERPRLHVFRSNRYTYAQIIDDRLGKTLAAVTEKEIKSSGTKTERATALGKLLGEKAKQVKVVRVCFDRGPNKYHGRLRALADAVRESGIEV
jgi:large subunit ribosomal protein L18